MNKGVQQVLIDPASDFAEPSQVVETDDLTIKEKIKILRSWEYDAREIEVAEEEGCPIGVAKTLLEDILRALRRLGVSPDINHSPPTKQGGV